MNYKVVPKIKREGWPVKTKSGNISKKWEKAHPAANRAAREKFGSRKAKAIAKLVQRTPENELLGSHTRKGEIRISKRVPKSLRPAIAYHEKVENRLMTGKK